MLTRFKSEHWHDEDEVRFIIDGRGLFHIHPKSEPVVAIEVEAGDLISVPRRVHHWFNLCSDLRIRAIRLFQDPAGWTPHYTESGKDTSYQPLCLGPVYIPVPS
jgi:1,2-dihydroxy-3-keto-5-methylthiopentene dioxygenase